MKSNILTVLVLLVVLGSLQAQQFAPVGTAVAQFLEIGVGARATAMGEAYTAITDDAGSSFWNPAGLANIEQRNFYLAYTSWPADISFGGFSLGWNLGSIGVVGVNAVYLNTDNMPVTTIFDPEGLSGETFNISNYALGLSYARYMTDNLAVGATVKLVSEDYYGHGYTGFALDLGTVYNTGFEGLKIAMSIMHFGPEIKFSGSFIDYSDPASVTRQELREFETYSLPVAFRFGVAMDIVSDQEHRLISAFDMVHPNNNLEEFNLGLEYGFRGMFFVRGGYKFQVDEGGLTLGLGVKYDLTEDYGLNLDYAFADMGVLPVVHRLSLGFDF